VAFPAPGRHLTNAHGIPVTLGILVATTGVAITTGQARQARTAADRLILMLITTSLALPALAWGRQ
jgi:hypothetical protein